MLSQILRAPTIVSPSPAPVHQSTLRDSMLLGYLLGFARDGVPASSLVRLHRDIIEAVPHTVEIGGEQVQATATISIKPKSGWMVDPKSPALRKARRALKKRANAKRR